MKSELWYTWSPWLVTENSPWEKVLHLGAKKEYKKNCVILGNGEPVKELFYLKKGQVSMMSTNAQGEQKIIWYLNCGNLFGEVPFIDEEISYSYFISAEDCIVYTFSRKILLEQILPNNPDIMVNMLKTLSKKVRILTGQINDLSLNTPKMRVYKMLYYLFSKTKGGDLHISQQELANLLGIHRVTLNQILSKLKKNGIIQQDARKKRITITEPQHLLQLIEAEQLS